jgi:hypothetical protein
MEKSKKLEKISLNKLEMNCFFGGASDMSKWTREVEPTSSNGGWGDCDTTVTYDGGAELVFRDYSSYC